MAQTTRRTSTASVGRKARPGQDMVTVSEQAAKFPGVGMTLRSYQYNAKDTNNRLGQPVAVKVPRWRRWFHKITLKRTVIVFAIILLLIGGWLGGKFIYNAHKLFGGNILGALHATKLKGEDTGRVNILLAGNSADDPGHDGAKLTDSIMILSIDTKNNKAFMLSIPRDLWVKVNSSSHAKINSAYVVGENNDFKEDGYPDGGMGKLEQVVSESMGIDINYYALIDYQALKQAVNAVGGVDVTVKSKDPRGLYDPSIDWETHGPLVKLTNGTHHLSGQQALNFARARGDSYYSYGFAGSDFDRTEHQRQLLVALKSKAVSAGVISNPAKISSLSDAIGNNVKTDFNTGEVRRLYDIVKQINSNNIQSLSLNSADGKNLLMSYSTPQGQSALTPAAGIDDFSDIQAFLARKMSSNPVVQEGAKIVILNGTTTTGLASKVKSKLTAKHYNVMKTGDAGITSQTTTAIINVNPGKKQATSAALAKQFGNHVTTQNPYAGMYEGADFIIVLGADQAAPPPSSTSSQ